MWILIEAIAVVAVIIGAGILQHKCMMKRLEARKVLRATMTPEEQAADLELEVAEELESRMM